MKKLLLTCAIFAACIAPCCSVMANPTTAQTTSGQSDSSDDSEFFLVEWLRSLFDHLFGWDRDNHRRSFSTGNNGQNYDSGDDGWTYDSDTDNDGWTYDSGDDGWNGDFGNDGWNYDSGNPAVPPDWNHGSGNNGWGAGDTGAGSVQPIPAPGALLLGGIGVSCISWLRIRRRAR